MALGWRIKSPRWPKKARRWFGFNGRPQSGDKIWPSFYTVPENTNAVVMVHPELVADLPGNPQSQLNSDLFLQAGAQSASACIA